MKQKSYKIEAKRLKQKKATKIKNLIKKTSFKLHNIHKRRGVLRTAPNFQDGDFCKNSQRFLSVARSYLSQKLYRVPSTCCKIVVRKLRIYKLKQKNAAKKRKI